MKLFTLSRCLSVCHPTMAQPWKDQTADGSVRFRPVYAATLGVSAKCSVGMMYVTLEVSKEGSVGIL